MTTEPRFYIAPTEPTELKELGKVTLIPETFGCDVLCFSHKPTIIIGYQRKEITDFLRSVSDGRLAKEMGQIRNSPILFRAILIIEGRINLTTEGNYASSFGQSISISQLRSLYLSVQLQEIPIIFTRDISDTISAIRSTFAYLIKPSHSSLLRRPKASLKNSWGRTTNESFASWLLQSFPGIGPKQAEEIYTRFGRAPLHWTATYDELVSIPGIGPKTAKRLLEALE